MNGKPETPLMPEGHLSMIDLDACHLEYQHSAQGLGGISSCPLRLLRQTAIVTGIVLIGTTPPPVGDVDLTSIGIEANFVFPSSSDATTEDEYSRIREEIAASGLPMLSDDEVRAEIRERKGVRGDTDS